MKQAKVKLSKRKLRRSARTAIRRELERLGIAPSQLADDTGGVDPEDRPGGAGGRYPWTSA